LSASSLETQLSVLRHFNRLLRLVYGPAYKKTYTWVYEGGRPPKRRTYRRIPSLTEFELSEFGQATRRLEQEQDVAQVA